MENVIGNCTNLKDVADLKMPKILEDITFKFARTIYPDMATSCLLGAVLTLVGFAISHKRIKFDEYDDGRNIRNFNIFTFAIVIVCRNDNRTIPGSVNGIASNRQMVYPVEIHGILQILEGASRNFDISAG